MEFVGENEKIVSFPLILIYFTIYVCTNCSFVNDRSILMKIVLSRIFVKQPLVDLITSKTKFSVSFVNFLHLVGTLCSSQSIQSKILVFATKPREFITKVNLERGWLILRSKSLQVSFSCLLCIFDHVRNVCLSLIKL